MSWHHKGSKIYDRIERLTDTKRADIFLRCFWWNIAEMHCKDVLLKGVYGKSLD